MGELWSNVWRTLVPDNVIKDFSNFWVDDDKLSIFFPAPLRFSCWLIFLRTSRSLADCSSYQYIWIDVTFIENHVLRYKNMENKLKTFKILPVEADTLLIFWWLGETVAMKYSSFSVEFLATNLLKLGLAFLCDVGGWWACIRLKRQLHFWF